MNTANKRVVSGMRATGRLHLGHYHGVLKNWLQLQHEYECFFFIADWHALTTHYANPESIEQNSWAMLIEWLAVGLSHRQACLFIQSWVPEHAELQLLLSMITPLSWLERVPSYKDQQAQLDQHDLSTYGFLGYPVLQSADVLLYHANMVPVGEDQAPHVELVREIARRFNHLYGREPDFIALAEKAITKLGKKNSKLYRELHKRYQEEGDTSALDTAQAFLAKQQNISLGDRERLFGYLEGGGKHILTEPNVLLTKTPKVTGLDGQKMSNSYQNTIFLNDGPSVVDQKIRTMPTDPARVKRTDPGDPEKCPVWPLHKLYSDESTQRWVNEGCRSAGIGCLDCKKPLIDAINRELAPIQENAKQYESDPSLLKSIVAEGSETARDEARKTLLQVKEAMGIDYSRG